MRFTVNLLTLLLVATSLNAAEPAAKQYVLQIKVLEGKLAKKETHKVLCAPTITTVDGRQAGFRSGGDARFPNVPGQKPAYFVEYGFNMQINPIALDADTVLLDLQLLNADLVTNNAEELEIKTLGYRWNKKVKLGKTTTFVFDKGNEKQTWAEVTVTLVNLD